MNGKVRVKINACIEFETERAVLFGEDTWIPKSVICSIEYESGGDSREVREGQRVRTVCVPEWFAEKNNLGY